jgi:60 kDa SS-A/Ro ribonucleoprotein
MQLNTIKRSPIYNNEGIIAKHINYEQALRRSVMACMLWENSFYEDGISIAERITALVDEVKDVKVAAIAVEAREKFKLRHAPLLIIAQLAAKKNKTPGLVKETLAKVIQRPDEITEFLAIYWRKGKCPLSGQVKKGLAIAFQKFDEYALAKYNRDGAVKLRDALFLCHAKPKDEQQEILWKKLVNNELATPDTWEVSLSSGGDKSAEWLRLLLEKKLGALALLRNLRNMKEAGIHKNIVASALVEMKTEKILPFRFISAARAIPEWEEIIEPAMLRCLEGAEKMHGKTVLLVDTSPSMNAAISAKSDLSRKDAALALAILLREICSDVRICAFSTACKAVPPRRGFALGDAIKTAVESSGTLLGSAISNVSGWYNRLIVITDEESQDEVPAPDGGSKAYMINVSSSKNGLGYGSWTHFDGWSEAIINYILECEREVKP